MNTSEDHLIETTAAELFAAYQMAIKADLLETRRTSDAGRAAQLGSRVELSYADADADAKKYFRRAARNCLTIGAEPREYIHAQFLRMEETSTYLGKVLLPMPYHIASTTAQVSYVEYKRRMAERKSRRAKPSKEHRVEDRRLRSLAKILRISEDEVLATKPEEFTRDYLKHRGVWELVQDRWEASREF